MNVNISHKGLTKIPKKYKDKIIDGSFNCDSNELTSLEGAPQEVGGYFYCHNNKLTSLEGAPQKVGGDFSCINNQLTSLEGAPQEVGGNFACYRNSNLPLSEILKYIIYSKIKGGINSDYNDEFLDKFNKANKHEKIKLIFRSI